jgi:leucyl-tRNA synthetase
MLICFQDVVKDAPNLRQGPKNYHDKVFEHETNNLINITRSHYAAYVRFEPFIRLLFILSYSTNYKDAMKTGFYEMQIVRDWYREVTADIGMHADMVMYWIRNAALVIAPIASHFAEHVWCTVLQQSDSIHHALWPTPTESVDPTIVETGTYMRDTIKMIRDSEASIIKAMNKSKGKKGGDLPYDHKKPRAVHVYVATKFPEWQDTCVNVVKDAYNAAEDKVDDVKVRALLTEKGLIKDKRAMPFIQAFKVIFKQIATFSC